MYLTFRFDAYLDFISRTTPCMVYFEDKTHPMNELAISNIEKMRLKYKYVLCYKAYWQCGNEFFRIGQKYSPNDILCFQRSNIFYHTSALSESNVESLFITVHNDCILNFSSSYNRILIKERKIRVGHIHIQYTLNNPAYDIFRGEKMTESIRSLLNDNKKESKIEKDLNKSIHVHLKPPNIKQTQIIPEVRKIVPVCQGLPSFKIFSVPLSDVPTSEYFKESDMKISSIGRNFQHDNRKSLKTPKEKAKSTRKNSNPYVVIQ